MVVVAARWFTLILQQSRGLTGDAGGANQDRDVAVPILFVLRPPASRLVSTRFAMILIRIGRQMPMRTA